MSRSQAKRTVTGHALKEQLASQGIVAGATDEATLVEAAPQAYKDVSEVVGAVHGAGIVKKVARMRPIGVVKG
jgi:tRNA-splicing ligase RtcB